MQPSRRSLLKGFVLVPTLARLAHARGLLTDRALDNVVQAGLEAAKKAGAGYADVRIVRRRWESIATREDHVSGVSSTCGPR